MIRKSLEDAEDASCQDFACCTYSLVEVRFVMYVMQFREFCETI